MGIKNFNKFLRQQCTKQAIRRMTFESFKGKSIVIDTSIFLYRFKKKHALVECMFLMMSLFIHYSIRPLFIFDGKPPEEKYNLLWQRVEKKREARTKLRELKKEHQRKKEEWEQKEESGIELDEEQSRVIEAEEEELIREMSKLEKESVFIRTNDIRLVQRMMELYSIPYITAPQEADQYCAYLVNTDQAWACMTDDMDMFMYGCKRVLRDPNLVAHDVLFYDTVEIARELNISPDVLTLLLIPSGTDYNFDTSSTSTADKGEIKAVLISIVDAIVASCQEDITSSPGNYITFEHMYNLYKKYQLQTKYISHKIWFYSWLVEHGHVSSTVEKEWWDVYRFFGKLYTQMSMHPLPEDIIQLWKRPPFQKKNKNVGFTVEQWTEFKTILVEQAGFLFPF